MSFEINWEDLTRDNCLNDNLRTFFDEQFNSITLPSFIDKLSVTDFSMGSTPPVIIIRHIGSPFDDFYAEARSEDEDKTASDTTDHSSSDSDETLSSEDEDESSTNKGAKFATDKMKVLTEASLQYTHDSGIQESPKHLPNYSMNTLGLGLQERETPTAFFRTSTLGLPISSSLKSDSSVDRSNDIQFVLEIDYHGDLMIEISVDLLVNYPSAHFISLPLKLKLSGLEVHSLAATAYIHGNVYFSFLCDLNTPETDYFSMSSDQTNNEMNGSKSASATGHGGNFVEYGSSNNKERIDVIRNVKIDTEIGENEHNVLRNVGKVEKFLVEQLRNIIRDELCWPGWVCFDLNNTSNRDD